MKRRGVADWLRTRTKGYQLWGITTQQLPVDLFWLDRCLALSKAGAVFELGTGFGGTAAWLGAVYPARVVSVDIVDKRPPHAKDLHGRLGVVFRQADAHDTKVLASLIAEARSVGPAGAPLFVLVDGGDKPLEWRLVAGLLKPRDFVVVHDNPLEFPADRLETDARRLGYQRILTAELAKDRSMFACYLLSP